jgi:hypothetical protein
MARLREPRAEVAADASRADHRNAHRTSPITVCLRASGRAK